jgi:hypothetical protein
MYALLGLADDVDHPEPVTRYLDDERVEAVCQRFATKMISKGRCGEVLSWAGYISQISTNRKDMPSWVPDWTSPTTNLWDTRHTMCFLMEKRRINTHHFFNTMTNDLGSRDAQAGVEQIELQLMNAAKEMESLENQGVLFDEDDLKKGAEILNEVKLTNRIYRATLESKCTVNFMTRNPFFFSKDPGWIV